MQCKEKTTKRKNEFEFFPSLSKPSCNEFIWGKDDYFECENFEHLKLKLQL